VLPLHLGDLTTPLAREDQKLREVRGPGALDMLKAWNTGHPGGITTVHANSAVVTVADIVRHDEVCRRFMTRHECRRDRGNHLQVQCRLPPASKTLRPVAHQAGLLPKCCEALIPDRVPEARRPLIPFSLGQLLRFGRVHSHTEKPVEFSHDWHRRLEHLSLIAMHHSTSTRLC
jgi:hypothetical protein